MPIIDQEGLDALCEICGITLSYYDIRGQRYETSTAVKQSLLAAMNLAVDDDVDVQRNFEIVRSRAWQSVIAPLLVQQKNELPPRLTLTLNEAQMNADLCWELQMESGQVCNGHWNVDPHHAIGEAVVNNVRLKQFEVDLNIDVGTGYHQLIVKAQGDTAVQALLVITPASCYLPPGMADGRKIWGIGLQLYALRSRRNWGIGDFADLRSAVEILAPLGVDIVGLNPLHALFTHLPENASPYSPSSRNFLNPIYLDVESIEELKHCHAAQRRIQSEPFQASLQALRARETIAYEETWSLKQEVLRMLYREFQSTLHDPDLARTGSFRQFQRDGGEDLLKFAVFEALQTHFHQQEAAVENWHQWPEAYRDPDSDATAEWAQSNIEAIEYYQYLQWNADQQLSTIHNRCKTLGMSIGVYRDLAVGDDKGGAACWADQACYAFDMGVGAPPDDFNLKGQNWTLPPPRPRAHGANIHGRFIQTVRANIRHAGALRIDHVMGLMRLFWIPQGCAPDQGTYVAYPFADLLGILALESQRNRCVIIGEDLGTVPDEVRVALDAAKILSYRILYFEKDWERGTINSPGEYPRYALCAAGSHDLPTLRGFWRGSDLDIREQLDLYPSADFGQRQRQVRQQDRDEILAALARQNLRVDENAASVETDNDMSRDLCLAIQRYLARSEALLLMVQAEDLLAQVEQMNVPGTIEEYPNWRYKLPLDLEDWRDNLDLEGFALAINNERSA